MLCANCGRELEERGCKVRCEGCGYFEDCSDPSAPGEWTRTQAPSASGPSTRVPFNPEDAPAKEL
jgi:hypothetical protein